MNDQIGDNIEAIRNARGWSQERLAAVAGVKMPPSEVELEQLGGA